MKEIISFDAIVIKCYTENDVRIIGIGDDEFEPHNYIIISKLEEDDVKCYRDSIYFESSISAIGYYNAIGKITMNNRVIDIVILEEKKEKIGASRFYINYEIKDIDLPKFLQYLGEIFDKDMMNIDIS